MKRIAMAIASLSLAVSMPANAFVGRVYDPPTNVRVYPGGPVRCSITTPTTLFFTHWVGEWNYSDGACQGRGGYIHDSQIMQNNAPARPSTSGYCILRGRTVPDYYCY